MERMLSLIMPTRRLSAQRQALAAQNAQRAGAREVVVVEPDDRGAESTATGIPSGWRLLRAPRGRGSQLAAGASAARGDLLLFVHDDTELPREAGALIQRAFSERTLGMACFRLRFDSRHWLLSLYQLASRLESSVTTFGDQAMVLTRDHYQAIGGFPAWPLFEDVELARRARRAGPIRKLRAEVTTSAVRFSENGLLRQQLANGLLLLRFRLGASPEALARFYERQRGASAPGDLP